MDGIGAQIISLHGVVFEIVASLSEFSNIVAEIDVAIGIHAVLMTAFYRMLNHRLILWLNLTAGGLELL